MCGLKACRWHYFPPISRRLFAFILSSVYNEPIVFISGLTPSAQAPPFASVTSHSFFRQPSSSFSFFPIWLFLDTSFKISFTPFCSIHPGKGQALITPSACNSGCSKREVNGLRRKRWRGGRKAGVKRDTHKCMHACTVTHTPMHARIIPKALL